MSDRRTTFRWVKVNERRKRHLWLGQATACGLTMTTGGGPIHTLSTALPDPACRACWAWLNGWLHRHDLGPRPERSSSPIAHGTITGASYDDPAVSVLREAARDYREHWHDLTDPEGQFRAAGDAACSWLERRADLMGGTRG